MNLNFDPLFERETKYAVPVNDHFYFETLHLAGVIELSKNENEKTTFHSVLGLDRFLVLYKHTFRSFLIPKLNLMEWHFINTSLFINKINIFQLKRSSTGFTANELADLIINTI